MFTHKGTTSYLLPGGPCSSQLKMVIVMPVPETSAEKNENGIETFPDKYLWALPFCSRCTKGIFEKVKSRSTMGFLGTAFSFLPYA